MGKNTVGLSNSGGRALPSFLRTPLERQLTLWTFFVMGSIVIELSRSLSLHFFGDTSFEQDSQVTSTAIVVSPSACALRRK